MNSKLLKRIAFIVGALSMLALFQNFTPTKKDLNTKTNLNSLNRMPSSDKTAIDFNQLTDESSQLESDLARKMKSLNSDVESQSK